MSKKKDVLDILKWMGIVVLGGVAGSGGMWLVLDAQENHFKNMGNGLCLLKDGVHMKQGEHNYVITDQFYEYLTYDTTPEQQDLAINCLKEGCKTMDKNNSCLDFNLCTTNDVASKKYNIQKIDKAGKQDIPLYITDKVLENNEHVMAKTDWSYDSFNFQMKDLSITFRKKFMFSVYNLKDSVKETLDVKNCVLYTTFVHEAKHTKGEAHNEICYVDENNRKIPLSIMYPYTGNYTMKDETRYDIEMDDRYNVQFYNAKPTIEYIYNTDGTLIKDKINENVTLKASDYYSNITKFANFESEKEL